MVNKNLVVVGVLILLVAVVLVQAVQLNSIRGSINEIGTTTSVRTSSASSGTSSASSSSSSSGGVPTNLQNLPGMVGGC